MDSRQRAQQIYDSLAQSRTPEYIRFYGQPQGIYAATVEEIQAHIDMVAAVSQEFGFHLDDSKIAFGYTREQVVAIAEAKRKHYNRRAGVRALEQKYGHEAASRIVYKHSGRHIR